MPRHEVLQILVPKAMRVGNLEVASRQFDLSLYTNTNNLYTFLKVDGIRYSPAVAHTQVKVFENEMEQGVYAGANGFISFDFETGRDTPIKLQLYNLSVDTDVMFSVQLIGTEYAIQRG